MRRIKEALHLSLCKGLNQTQVAGGLSVARSTVQDYQHRADHAGLTADSLATLTEETLEKMLFRREAPPSIRNPIANTCIPWTGESTLGITNRFSRWFNLVIIIEAGGGASKQVEGPFFEKTCVGCNPDPKTEARRALLQTLGSRFQK